MTDQDTTINQVRLAIWHGLQDVLDGFEGIDSIIEAMQERHGTIFCCAQYGHYWVDDQCHRPEHRYCLFCETMQGNI